MKSAIITPELFQQMEQGESVRLRMEPCRAEEILAKTLQQNPTDSVYYWEMKI